MEALGAYTQLASPARELASAVFILTLCVMALLERLQFKLRKTEASTWWASNGRDVLNLVALGASSVGLKVLGFAGPISFCMGATLVILLSALQTSLGERKLASLMSVAAAIVLGLPILVAPRAVHDFFRAALELLFPAS